MKKVRGPMDHLSFLPPDLHRLMTGAGTVCPNCSRPKKEGAMCCDTCVEAGKALDRLLAKGIEIEYADGTTETIKSKKSTTYKRKR